MGATNYKGLILDLDQTLIDSSIAEPFRGRNWQIVYDLVPQFKEFEGMNCVFSTIKMLSIPVCIVTNSIHRYVEVVAERFHIPYDHIIDYCATRDPLTGRCHPKPNPLSMQIAMNKLGAMPSEIISVGDSITDLLASRSAGINEFWGCTWGILNKSAFDTYGCTILSSTCDMSLRLQSAFFKAPNIK